MIHKNTTDEKARKDEKGSTLDSDVGRRMASSPKR
jgi:hypothetical protein